MATLVSVVLIYLLFSTHNNTVCGNTREIPTAESQCVAQLTLACLLVMSAESEKISMERKRRAPSAEQERMLLPDVPSRRRRTKSLSPEHEPRKLADQPAAVVPEVEQPIQFKEAEICPLQIVNQDAVPIESPVNKTKFRAYKVHIVQQTERKEHGLDFGFPDIWVRRRDTITGRVSVRYIGTAKLFKFVKKSRFQTD